MGVGSGEGGDVPHLDFQTWYKSFFGLFCYFFVVFFPFSPSLEEAKYRYCSVFFANFRSFFVASPLPPLENFLPMPLQVHCFSMQILMN